MVLSLFRLQTSTTFFLFASAAFLQLISQPGLAVRPASEKRAWTNSSSSQTPPPESNNRPTRQTRVNFLLTRHALSCANVVDKFGGKLSKTHAFLSDPMLSACGRHRSSEAASPVLTALADRKIDLVLSSSMVRAIETAANQYPGRIITPVPFISEKWHTWVEKDNLPEDVEPQKAKLGERYAVEDITTKEISTPEAAEEVFEEPSGKPWLRVDFRWMKDPTFRKGRSSPNFEEFRKFVVETLLPAKGLGDEKEVTLAVVTHSNFVKKSEPMRSTCEALVVEGPGEDDAAGEEEEEKDDATGRSEAEAFSSVEEAEKKGNGSPPVASSTPGRFWHRTRKNPRREIRKPHNNEVLEVSFRFTTGKTTDLSGQAPIPYHLAAEAMEGSAWKTELLAEEFMRQQPDKGVQEDEGSWCRQIFVGFETPSSLCHDDVGQICFDEIDHVGQMLRPKIGTLEGQIVSVVEKINGKVNAAGGDLTVAEGPEVTKLFELKANLEARLHREGSCCVR